MVIIGENINTSEEDVNILFDTRDSQGILELVDRQMKWGSSMLAINCATREEAEVEDLQWVTRVICDRFDIPLCFDSPNPEAQEAALKVYSGSHPAMINSITAEEQSMSAMIPLAEKYGTMLTAILHDEAGMPTCVEDRLRVIPLVIERCMSAGIKAEELYLDALVFPIATDEGAANSYLEVLGHIRREYPQFKTICGLNNISYGLPFEDHLNGSFYHMCDLAGQHAAYMLLSDSLYASISSLRVLKAEDPYCTSYLQAYRDGMLGKLS